MNYALDALWWRLTHPQVRDLASLLTAPNLWHTKQELPIRTLLGEQGFRYLLTLDENAEDLVNYLQQYPTQYLGHYAEHLLAFWFSHAPHAQLIERNIVLNDGSQTIGELDFLVYLNQQAYHIELTCKYYGAPQADEKQLIGLNPQDRFLKKQQKLSQQLALSQQPLFLRHLQQYNITHTTAVSITRGIVFCPKIKNELNHLNPYAWRGNYGFATDTIMQQYPNINHYRFKILDRLAYLAPMRCLEDNLFTIENLQAPPACLITQLEKRADQHWHEIQRYFHP